MNVLNKLSRRVLKSHIAISSQGKNTRVTYFSPKHQNDRKRIGTELVIRTGNVSVALDGTGRRVLESVLKKIRKAEKVH